MAIYREPLASDVDLKAAIHAHAGTSHTPERRGQGEVESYISSIREFYEALQAVADSGEKLAFAAEATEDYRVRYIKFNNELWASRSRLMSAMIAGPARFPTARNEKRYATYEKKARAFYDWSARARAIALREIKKIGQPLAPIDPNAPTGTEALEVNGVQIVKNFDLDRVQILFGGRPDAETITALKRSGWNWSPRNSAWQRKLTDAAHRSARQIVEAV
ncbi:hypothetical protein ACWTU6_27070 [Mesorhizobium sp. BHbsci]